MTEYEKQKMTELKKRVLNGGRGSGQSLRLLVDIYENQIKALQKQIDKMKCCYNCKHTRTEYEHCKTDKYEKWELAE